MRDREKIVDLLRQLAEVNEGRLQVGVGSNDREQDQLEFHHAELLCDAEHAEWTSEPEYMTGVVRITMDGYDFLDALDKGPNTIRERFSSLMNKGVPYLDAAQKAMRLFKEMPDL